MLARVVDEDAPYQLRRHAEKLRAILIDQLDIDLVDERRRRRVSHALAPQVPGAMRRSSGQTTGISSSRAARLPCVQATSSWVTGPGAETITLPNQVLGPWAEYTQVP